MKKFGLVIAIVLGIVILLEYRASRPAPSHAVAEHSAPRSPGAELNPLTGQSVEPTLPITPVASTTPLPLAELEFPALYPGFQWGKTSLTTTVNFAIYYDDFAFQRDPKNGAQSSAPATGETWTACRAVGPGTQANDIAAPFISYYSSELETKRGWSENLVARQMTLHPQSSDSPSASTWGYLKTDSDVLRVVLLSDNTADQRCPNGVQFTVFLSHAIPISKLPPLH